MKKTIKKIVALGIGASMVGATLMGAMAANLNDYPAPFVQGGKFSGTLVVGDNAAAEDIIGVSDIAMSLQYASSVKAGSSGGSTTTVEGDAYRVTSGGNDMNLYQNLSEIKNTLDDSHLTALNDGKYTAKNNVDYTQTLTMPAAAVMFVVDDDAAVDDPALYLKFTTDRLALDYSLDFTTAAESDFDTSTLEDFEDNKIGLLGKEYTITQAINQSSNTMKLTLMSGAIQETQEVGETKTYSINGKDYEVTVLVVSGDTSATAVTKFIVNDEVTKSLSKDGTYTLKDGLELGIKEVLPTKAGDVQQNLVEFFLGAHKIVLDGSNNRLEIAEETINDVTVTVTGSQTASEKKLSRIRMMWYPSNDYYVPVGGKLSQSITDESDYVTLLEAFGIDYQFSGVNTGKTEMLSFKPSGSTKYKMTFTNNKGTEYSFDAFYYNSTIGGTTNGVVSLGESASKPLRTTEGETVCDNHYFTVEGNKDSRVLQLTHISSTDNTVSVKDLGTGDTNDYSFSGENTSATLVMDGNSYTLNVTDVANKCVTLLATATDSADSVADLWTQYDYKIQLKGPGSDANIIITEDNDGKEESSSDIDSIWLNFSYSTSDSELRLDTSAFDAMAVSGTTVMLTLDSDSNQNQGYTEYGTYITQKQTDDQDRWDFVIPENEVIADVFVTAGSTMINTISAEGEAVVVQRIDVGATKLASEVAGTETSQNLLLVGGPCANPAVEAASDDFPTCGSWSLGPGEALIQLVEQTDGSMALLVAGTNAADTRAATKMVAEASDLAALADDVSTQVLTVSTGVLTDMAEPVVEDVMVDEGTSAE